jgi:hypothetical protein
MTMKTHMAGLGLILGLATSHGAAQAQDLACESTAERSAARLGGEVGGPHRQWLPFGPGLVLALVPAKHGWNLRILDSENTDLSQMTPPLNGPNARDIHGWHFRNADNTGANDGSVNAPQHLRLFIFSPALSGTGGFKPSREITPKDVEDAEGRGWLKILDMGLSDLEPGQQARMTYLKFIACVTWPKSLDIVLPPSKENVVTPELRERFGACGLGADHALGTYLTTASLGGDFDGDDSLDVAAPVTRQTDGKRAIAICRAGTWLDIVGLEGEMGELVPAYFDHIDWWILHPAGEPVGLGATGGPVPTLHGDAIRIGKEGASSTLFFWTPDGYASYWQGD